MPRFLLGAAALAVLASPAAAASCAPPAQLASLPIHWDGPSGIFGFSVPVAINGQQRRMRLSLGPHTIVAKGFLGPDAVLHHIYSEGSLMRLVPTAKVESLALGHATGSNLLVDTMPGDPKPDDPIGDIGTGILGNFDVEIDFAAGKVNLFEHEACAGGGVRWASSYTTVPFEMASLKRVAFAMELDGKSVSVTMPLDNFVDSMPMTSAARLFGLQADDPRIDTQKPDQSITVLGHTVNPDQLVLRQYTFGRLSSGDFVVDNPRVRLTGQAGDPVCDGKTKTPQGKDTYSICFGEGDLALGLTTLRTFHLYFAFKEQVLYVTPAQPPAGPQN